MSVVTLPTAATSRRVPVWVMALVPLIVLGGAGVVFKDRFFGSSTSNPVTGTFQPAVVIDLDVRLAKDGELQSVNNIDVINRVEGLSTIVELVKEGTFVHRGDKLVVLDSSNIQKAFDQSLLDLQTAEASLASAKEAKEIQEAINKANLQEAELGVQLAKLALKEYMKGTAPAAEAEARTKLRMAEIMVKNKEEDLATTRNLFARGFVTAADVKKAELEVLTVQNDLRKAETDLMVLLDYTHLKNMATKESDVAQAEQKLERTRKENLASMNKLGALLRQAEQSLDLRKQLHAKLQEQLDYCTIRAPADGMVVYATSSDRYGSEPIKDGANVRNLQTLIRLPDTSQMKAVVRVQEGQVSKLRVDDNNPMRATVNIVGLKRPIGGSVAKISVLADSGSRWWNPDLKEYPVEVLLDETPANCKPGMGCQVEVLLDRKAKVVAVPMTAIYTQGLQSFVFVRDQEGTGAVPIEVKIGATNETHAEILNGLAAGQETLLLQPGQGRVLLEKAGVKLQPTTRPGETPGKGRGRRSGGGGPRVGDATPGGGASTPATVTPAAPRGPEASALLPGSDRSSNRPAQPPATVERRQAQVLPAATGVPVHAAPTPSGAGSAVRAPSLKGGSPVKAPAPAKPAKAST